MVSSRTVTYETMSKDVHTNQSEDALFAQQHTHMIQDKVVIPVQPTSMIARELFVVEQEVAKQSESFDHSQPCCV